MKHIRLEVVLCVILISYWHKSYQDLLRDSEHFKTSSTTAFTPSSNMFYLGGIQTFIYEVVVETKAEVMCKAVCFILVALKLSVYEVVLGIKDWAYDEE